MWDMYLHQSKKPVETGSFFIYFRVRFLEWLSELFELPLLLLRRSSFFSPASLLESLSLLFAADVAGAAPAEPEDAETLEAGESLVFTPRLPN